MPNQVQEEHVPQKKTSTWYRYETRQRMEYKCGRNMMHTSALSPGECVCGLVFRDTSEISSNVLVEFFVKDKSKVDEARCAQVPRALTTVNIMW
jgi:hypothetical protein